MTKEITKAAILQEIRDKFRLREYAPSKFLFDETVVPVYDINAHLHAYWQKYVTKSITGTGAYVFFPVPENERWHICRYDVVFMTGVYTIAGVFYQRPTNRRDPADAYLYLDLTAAQTVSYHTELKTELILDPKSSLSINVDGYTSIGNLRLYVDYMVEEIR